MDKQKLYVHETDVVAFNSLFYVDRDADSELLDLVSQGRQIALVKGPFKTGKSSMLSRLEKKAKENKQLTCYIDFQSFDATDFESLQKLFERICQRLSASIANPGYSWDINGGVKYNFANFIEKMLKRKKPPVLVLLDEIDRVLSFPAIRDDFFSTLRYLSGIMSSSLQDKKWKRFSLIIAHYTGTHRWIEDPNQSHFNVGYRFILGSFDLQQIIWLKQQYGFPLANNGDEIDKLINFTGGLPFLTRWALCQMKIKNYGSVDELRELKDDDIVQIEDFLKRVLFYLKQEGLTESFRQVLKKGKCKNNDDFDRLKDIGLVKGDSYKNTQVFCELYEIYFRKNF